MSTTPTLSKEASDPLPSSEEEHKHPLTAAAYPTATHPDTDRPLSSSGGTVVDEAGEVTHTTSNEKHSDDVKAPVGAEESDAEREQRERNELRESKYLTGLPLALVL